MTLAITLFFCTIAVGIALIILAATAFFVGLACRGFLAEDDPGGSR